MSAFEFANKQGTTGGNTPLENSRNRAIRYYNSIIYPSTPENFDQRDMRPRTALNAELELIAQRFRSDRGYN